MSSAEPDIDWEGHLSPDADAHYDMTLRALFSNEWCTRPKNFNVHGLLKIMEHGEVNPSTRILDVGCGSGNPIMTAESIVKTGADFWGLDRLKALHDYFSTDFKGSNFKFKHGFGEDIPFPDDFFDALSAHNMVFRSRDIDKVLQQFTRVTRHGAIIVISTNGREHAPIRHGLGITTALQASLIMGGKPVTVPEAPAKGVFTEDLTEIIRYVGKLEIIEDPFKKQDKESKSPDDNASKDDAPNENSQKGLTVITEDRLPLFAQSIKHVVKRTNLARNREGVKIWERIVDESVVPLLASDLQDNGKANQEAGIHDEPCITDDVDRGMFVVRNNK